MADPKADEEMRARPTPPSGLPAVVAETDEAKRSDEIVAPRADATVAILAALTDLREEVRETREESRKRGEETAASFGKLEGKVDAAVERLSEDDQALRLDFRRLEQRQASSDEDRRQLREEVRELREEARRDREERSRDKIATTDTFEAMKRYVEDATRSHIETFDRAMKATAANGERFDAAIDRVVETNAKQDERIGALEKQGEALSRASGAICDELGLERPEGLEPSPEESERKGGVLQRVAPAIPELGAKTDRNRRVTWAAVVMVGLQLAYALIQILSGKGGHLL